MTTTTYKAECYRDDGWWAIEVPEVFGVHTQARRLEQVPAVAREAIALVLEVDEATVDVEVVAVLEGPLREVLDRVDAARRAAEVASAAAAEAARAAASALHDAGLSMRDVGVAMGVSHQRVHQLLK